MIFGHLEQFDNTVYLQICTQYLGQGRVYLPGHSCLPTCLSIYLTFYITKNKENET